MVEILPRWAFNMAWSPSLAYFLQELHVRLVETLSQRAVQLVPYELSAEHG